LGAAINELIELLTRQKALLEEILPLALEKRVLIVNTDSEKLEELIRQELRAINKLSDIEKKRIALLPKVIIELGLTGSDTPLSVIAKHSPAPYSDALGTLHEELRILVKELTELNDGNREMINAHKEYTETMMEMMVEAEDPLNNFYGGDGKAPPEKKRTTGFFDGQA